MSALVRLTPMPDELDRGYMGRLMRVNGYISELFFFRAAERNFGFDGGSRYELTKTELLAAVAGLPTESFVISHSTLPLRRSITASFPEIAHGSTDNRNVLARSTMTASRVDAYFCAACAGEDVDFHGLSYWRRSLQIPGMLWCTRHDLPLRYMKYKNAMSHSPDELREASDAVDGEFVSEAMANPHVKNFFAIASGLMDHHKPVPTEQARLVLQERAIAMGLQSGSGAVRKPLLSDLVSRSFPRRWLWTVYPDVAEKSQGEFMYRVDGIFTMTKGAASIWPYLLAMAVLFDSPDKALNALFAAQETDAQRPKRPKRKDPNEFTSGEWRSSRQRSIHNLIDSPSKEIMRAAFMFYVEKKELTECVKSTGTSLKELENFIRQISPAFVSQLIDMESKNFAKRSARKITRALSPDQVAQASVKPVHRSDHALEIEFQN